MGRSAMVFSMRLSARDFVDWPDGITIIMFVASIPLLLAAAALLFRFLPRVFAGSYGPSQSLGEALAMPGVRRSIAWLAATIFVGIGALLWGIAADFFPGRKLLLLAALLLVTTAVAFWVTDGPLALAIVFSVSGLVRGGLICLPWVLMAELLPTQHFAKIALGITFVTGLLGGSIGLILWGLFQDVWGRERGLIVVLAEGVVLALAATRLPGPDKQCHPLAWTAGTRTKCTAAVVSLRPAKSHHLWV